MTNRTLTALAIRFGGLLLFIKIFDFFGSHFTSVYFTAIFPIFEESLNEPLEKFYYTGLSAVIVNIVVSLFLVIKADWISKRLIRNDTELSFQFDIEQLMKLILLVMGIIWVARGIYLLPDFIDYLVKSIQNISADEKLDVPSFSLWSYILNTALGLFFIFKASSITRYFKHKLEPSTIK